MCVRGSVDFCITARNDLVLRVVSHIVGDLADGSADCGSGIITIYRDGQVSGFKACLEGRTIHNALQRKFLEDPPPLTDREECFTYLLLAFTMPWHGMPPCHANAHGMPWPGHASLPNNLQKRLKQRVGADIAAAPLRSVTAAVH